MNTTTKPAELIFNNDNEYGLTIDDVKDITENWDLDEKVYCNIVNFRINNGEGDIEEVDLTNRDNLQSPVEKFLYDFTCNSDNAKWEWGDQWEHEIKPKLKQMIKNSPTMKGMAYRYESPREDGKEIKIGAKINFDCRSVADDNEGFDIVNGFAMADWSNPDVIMYVFPEDTKGLNIQGCSVYPNQHEYLVDGDFIIDSIDEEEDEFGNTPKIVYLKKSE